jgi:hypothetical protein
MQLIDFERIFNKFVCEPLTNQGFASNLEQPINYFLTFDRAGKPSGTRVLCLAL